MAFSPTLSHVVLVITAAVLFYAALTDLRHFKIGNELILVLIGLFIVHALLSGRWVTAHWNLAFAAFMFVIMVYFYSQNLMGGGDVKMLAVAFLWTGIWCAFVFAVLMAIFAMVQVLLGCLQPVQINSSVERSVRSSRTRMSGGWRFAYGRLSSCS